MATPPADLLYARVTMAFLYRLTPEKGEAQASSMYGSCGCVLRAIQRVQPALRARIVRSAVDDEGLRCDGDIVGVVSFYIWRLRKEGLVVGEPATPMWPKTRRQPVDRESDKDRAEVRQRLLTLYAKHLFGNKGTHHRVERRELLAYIADQWQGAHND